MPAKTAPTKTGTPHEPRAPGDKTDETAPPKKPFRTPGKNMTEPAPHVGTDGHSHEPEPKPGDPPRE
ncbi:MAG: hypothetical protein Q8R02_04415 [Hyphomonadaceae bacterium]|nr:hypothetical protein [Hyphomonadaceae bacterium]